jgi:hypothetical protein
MFLSKKKPEKPVLFENFVKNHSFIIKREKDKNGIDYIQYKAEIVKLLVVSFIKAIDQQRPYNSDNLNSHSFIFQ